MSGTLDGSGASAVPPAPTGVRATASPGSARVTWSHGSGPAGVTGHVVTGSDGQTRSVGPDQVTVVTGLVDGQAYSFTVAAVNAAGTGPASAPSAPVVPSPPTPGDRWAPTTPMPTGRQGAAAVRLHDGRVLVAGGTGPGPSGADLAACEVFDALTGTWTAVEAMGALGSRVGLTLLVDGRVLRSGGLDASATPLATTELLAPVTGQWTPAVPMATARFGHTATLLADGRVLAAGGLTATSSGWAAVASAELYDPASGQWSPTGSLATARSDHSATRLLDGRVLVVGGAAGAAGFASAELYDPTGATWSATGAMSTERQDDDVCCPGTARLPSGDVLVAGGSGPQGLLASAEVYRVATGTWQPTGDLVAGRDAGFRLVPLLDGRVLVAGGRDDWGALAYAELYDEVTGTWTRTNDTTVARMSPAAALLADGRVLVAGGSVLASPTSGGRSVETFSPA